jgi:hypothetical protein
MTQPATVVHPATPIVPIPKKTYSSVKDVYDAIVDRLGEDVDIEELRQIDAYTWLPRPNDPTYKVTFFKRGRQNPFNEYLDVFALFHRGDDVYVYSLPVRSPPATADGKEGDAPVPTCHILCKKAPTMITERMQLETFIAEVTDEWINVSDESPLPADDLDDDEESATEETATPLVSG